MKDKDKTAQEVARLLLSIQAVTFNAAKPYRYTTGLLSPVYSDMRLLISYPVQRKKVLDMWLERIAGLGEFDVIAGTSTAGIPHAAWIADRLNKPMVYIRDKAKGHGKMSQIEGVITPGQRALIVEDLISTGKSSVGSVEAAREAGAVVDCVTAIYNYRLPSSAPLFASKDVKLAALTTFTDVINAALEQGYIQPPQYDLVLDWFNDPAGWGKRNGFGQ